MTRTRSLMKTFTSVTSRIQTITLSFGRGPLRDVLCPLATMLSQSLASLVFFVCAALFVQPSIAAPFQWEYTGSLNNHRAEHTATLLANGQVLVASGPGASDSAELYDPATGLWTGTGGFFDPRDGHTATLLLDGRVLVAGGQSNAHSPYPFGEVYNPATGSWSTTDLMYYFRYYPTATLLANGNVVVAGGVDNVMGGDLATAERYYLPGYWVETYDLNHARAFHTATLLPNGKVLVAGGQGPLANAELYDPATHAWTYTGSLNTAHSRHTATLLPNGKVLVAGGATAELYDPDTGTWTYTGSLNTVRSSHTATLLPDGKVLVAGGYPNVASAELYDPATGTWTYTGSLNTVRSSHTATLLPNGKVLVAGGYDANFNFLDSAELYDPGIGFVATLTSAASRLTHGSAGTFDINMPLTGTSGVEDRSSSTYTAVFTFDGPVTSGEVTVTSGTATVGAITFSGNEMLAALTGVTDIQTVVLHTQNINGDGLPHGDVPFGFLKADVNGNRIVDTPDLQQINADRNQPVTASNFRDDINLSGIVDRPDLQSLRTNRGHSIP